MVPPVQCTVCRAVDMQYFAMNTHLIVRQLKV